jgi:hypothetical protein
LGQEDTVPVEYSVSDTIQSDFNLFGSDEILEISLKFDVTTYIRKKPKDEYSDAILTYHVNETDSISKTIRLKSRGNFRNQYCSFPPIKLNFKKTDFKYEDLNKISTVKLVTHCKPTKTFEKYILKEYLTYKLYNLLSEYSFKTRLVRIKYIDTGKKQKNYTHYGFFIEPTNLMAGRTNSTIVKKEGISQKHIIPEEMNRVAIFYYMIGNTDWSLPIQHNMKIVVPRETLATSQGIIVPYDFDYCGLVDTHYAIPHESFNIKNVKERLYLGICRDKEIFIQALKEFSEKKEVFYKIINDFEFLDDKSKKEMTTYIDSFFEGFDKRNTVVNDILSNCKEY